MLLTCIIRMKRIVNSSLMQWITHLSLGIINFPHMQQTVVLPADFGRTLSSWACFGPLVEWGGFLWFLAPPEAWCAWWTEGWLWALFAGLGWLSTALNAIGVCLFPDFWSFECCWLACLLVEWWGLLTWLPGGCTFWTWEPRTIRVLSCYVRLWHGKQRLFIS